MAPKTENIIVAIVYDFETGGLDCTKCAATQISMHAVRLDTFEVMDTYNSYIYPYSKIKTVGKTGKKTLKTKYEVDDEKEEGEKMAYQQAAMDISGISLDMLYSMGKELTEVCNDICDFIEKNTFPIPRTAKPFMVGQNPLFDNGFMQQIMCYTGMYGRFCKLVRGTTDFWGNFQAAQLDTIILAQLALGEDKSISTWKLESTAERLGIDMDDAHDADADVTATREITRILTERMRNQDASVGLAGGSVKKQPKLRDHFKI